MSTSHRPQLSYKLAAVEQQLAILQAECDVTQRVVVEIAEVRFNFRRVEIDQGRSTLSGGLLGMIFKLGIVRFRLTKNQLQQTEAHCLVEIISISGVGH